MTAVKWTLYFQALPVTKYTDCDHTHCDITNLKHVNISSGCAVAYVHLGHLLIAYIARIQEFDFIQFSVGIVAAALRQGIGLCWEIALR